MLTSLLDYVRAAMLTAKCDSSAEDGTWRGVVPGFHGVEATATTKPECEKRLQEILEDWVLFRVFKNLPLPDVNNTNPAAITLDNEAQRWQKIQQLETEIESLKLELRPARKPQTLVSRVQRFNDWYKTYFTLISAIFAAIILFYAYVIYGFDPAQTYRENYVKKSSSEFYGNLGDRMMDYGELKAAEEAYNTALKINPYNYKATRGLVKTEIFDPLEGQKYYAPEVVDAKLVYMRQLFTEYEDAYLIPYLEGFRLQHQRDYAGAKIKFQESIDKNPRFISGHNQLGFSNILLKDGLKEAVSHFEEAIKIYPGYAPAHSNLGSCYISLERFSAAIEHLEKSYKISVTLETAINMGEAYRFNGDIKQAINYHSIALSGIETPEVEKERFFGRGATFNYMPDSSDDYVKVQTKDQYKIFVFYGLSFDYALMADLKSAEKNFETAAKLDSTHYYSKFFANRVNYILNRERLFDSAGAKREEARAWFKKHLTLLNDHATDKRS